MAENTLGIGSLSLPHETNSDLKKELEDFNTRVEDNVEFLRKPPNTAITANYTALETDSSLLVDATSGVVTITLPEASTVENKVLFIKKTDSSTNAVTVDGNGSQTIDGSTTHSLSKQYDAIEIKSDGSNWHILSNLPKEVALADIENINTDRLLGRDTAGSGAIEQITLGTNVAFNSGALEALESGTWSADLAGGSRSAGTNYQNTSGVKRRVCIDLAGANLGTLNASFLVGSASPPATSIQTVKIDVNAVTDNHRNHMYCEVPDSWYYKVTITAGSLGGWYELDE